MAQLLNWMELNQWIAHNPWVVAAACDCIALLAVVSIARLVARRQIAADPVVSLPDVTEVAPPEKEVPVSEHMVSKPEIAARPAPEHSQPVRKDIRRALAAISRWEQDYRQPQGIQELAHMVESRRNKQPRVPTSS